MRLFLFFVGAILSKKYCQSGGWEKRYKEGEGGHIGGGFL